MPKPNDPTRCLDLDFLGQPGVIATGVIDTPDGALLVDPGPASCLDALTSGLAALGLRDADVRGILVTHIHLDHAGASGTLVRRFPRLTVYVHERGAPHLADPSRLVASATRIYGHEMDRLWGEFVPVPAENLHALAGGERLRFGTRAIDVAYTPGHAWHHVSYHDTHTGVAYTGDVAGIRIGAAPYVLPPTPPPDIELDTWRRSLAAIRAWQPSSVFVTHFGLKADAAAHLDMAEAELNAWAQLSHDLVTRADDTAGEALFVERVAGRIVAHVGAEAAAGYRSAVPLEHCWLGLARYWKKRLPETGSAN